MSKKKLKRQYGEPMMHYLRSEVPSLYESDELLDFLNSRFWLCDRKLVFEYLKSNNELTSLVEFIRDRFAEEIKTVETEKTVKELLDEQGYDIHESMDNDDVRSYRKFYRSGEKLCTFNDSRRIDRNRIFWLRKKDFAAYKPHTQKSREDDYSTSLLCIQFGRHNNSISIKSRYNHHVGMPDSVYDNNLEKIAPGLTDAFKRDYGIDITRKATVDSFIPKGFYKGQDGMFYHINATNGDLILGNNVVINKTTGEVKEYDPAKFVTIDNTYLADLEEQKIVSPIGLNKMFAERLNMIYKKIVVVKNEPQERENDILYVVRF